MGDKDYLQGADLLVDGGKIVAAGPELSAPGAKVVDAKGLWALPGLIDAHCHLGMWEEGMRWEGEDGNECTCPVTPGLRALDAVNPFDPGFQDALEAGVTTVATGPGSANVVGGQFIAMKTLPGPVDEHVLRAPLALKTALGENPKGVYGQHGKAPQTRMATASLFRQAMIDGLAYAQKLKDEKVPDRNLDKEILALAAEGKLRVKTHAHRADDILTALRLREEFHLDMTLEHCTEGHLVLPQLKKAGIPVILGPLLVRRSKVELRNRSYAAPTAYYRAGVRFAMMSDYPMLPVSHLLCYSALCVREGLPEREALLAVTKNAAWALGLEDRLGSLEPGKDADFALYDGDPLDVRSRVREVYVDGQLVSQR